MPTDPLSLHPDNPHYMVFRGKPAVLITSGEHYGAVMNLDFDYHRYLDALAEGGFNLTRLFSGTYRERPGSHRIQNNTMAPQDARFICPWRCVERGPGNAPLKWDLTRWDEAYWQRLRDFVAQAGARGIVVEYVLFCYMYSDELWRASPLHPDNNVNGLRVENPNDIFKLDNSPVLAAQEAFVRKAAQELNRFDNVYYEIANELYVCQDGTLYLDWQHHLVDVLREEERALPARHLVAINYWNNVGRAVPLHPDVDILNFHYAFPEAVAWNYGLDRVIADDETGFKGWTSTPYRTEAWAFMLSGGAVFSHLDYSFTVAHPDGTAALVDETPGHGGPAWRAQLSVLKRFLDAFDLPPMAPHPEAAMPGTALNTRVAVLAEPGRQYAVYLWGGGPNTDLRVQLPAGSYEFTWTNPSDGRTIRTTEVDGHSGGTYTVRTPTFLEDLALSIIRR